MYINSACRNFNSFLSFECKFLSLNGKGASIPFVSHGLFWNSLYEFYIIQKKLLIPKTAENNFLFLNFLRHYNKISHSCL